MRPLISMRPRIPTDSSLQRRTPRPRPIVDGDDNDSTRGRFHTRVPARVCTPGRSNEPCAFMSAHHTPLHRRSVNTRVRVRARRASSRAPICVTADILRHVRRSCGTKSRDEPQRKRHASMHSSPPAYKSLAIAHVADRALEYQNRHGA